MCCERQNIENENKHEIAINKKNPFSHSIYKEQYGIIWKHIAWYTNATFENVIVNVLGRNVLSPFQIHLKCVSNVLFENNHVKFMLNIFLYA